MPLVTSSSSSSPSAEHQFCELAALAFPAIQHLRGRSTVSADGRAESGSAAGGLAVALVELIDACCRGRENSSSPETRSLSGLERVREQGERQVPSRLLKQWTSTCAIGASTSAGVVSSIGTTTSVPRFSGSPSSRSSRGSGRGPSTGVTVQSTSAVASPDAGPRARTRDRDRTHVHGRRTQGERRR